jgi:uncharacterized membrane protein YfcA
LDTISTFLVDGTGLALWSFALLCGVSFLGSFITAALGLGGGTLTLASMALFMPPVALIPLHGVMQLGSNGGRALLMYRHVLKGIVPVFLIGTIVGAAIGGQVVVTLPIYLLKSILAVFILYSVWAPRFQASDPGKKTFFGVGALAAFTTMFVGATGVLIAPFVFAACRNRQEIVATHATLMTIQHFFKVIVFGFLGFAFGPYIPFLIGVIVFGFAGTYIGKFALDRLPEHLFRTILKFILTALAARLLYSAAAEWVA